MTTGRTPHQLGDPLIGSRTKPFPAPTSPPTVPTAITAISAPNARPVPTAPTAPNARPVPTARTGAKRKHPARGARVGALILSCAATGGLTYFFADANALHAASTALAQLPAPIAVGATPALTPAPSTNATAGPLTPATSATTAVNAAPTTAKATKATPTTTAKATPTTKATATAKAKAFNGSVIDTKFGPVQIQVQITGGKISEVAILQYPDSADRSVQINANALPTLRSESLSAQSASVHAVSGATYTSRGYVKSLQSAIDQARAAGATTIA